jgi:hypothetical protein
MFSEVQHSVRVDLDTGMIPYPRQYMDRETHELHDYNPGDRMYLRLYYEVQVEFRSADIQADSSHEMRIHNGEGTSQNTGRMAVSSTGLTVTYNHIPLDIAQNYSQVTTPSGGTVNSCSTADMFDGQYKGSFGPCSGVKRIPMPHARTYDGPVVFDVPQDHLNLNNQKLGSTFASSFHIIPKMASCGYANTLSNSIITMTAPTNDYRYDIQNANYLKVSVDRLTLDYGSMEYNQVNLANPNVGSEPDRTDYNLNQNTNVCTFYIPEHVTSISKFVEEEDPFIASYGSTVFSDLSGTFHHENRKDNIPITPK